MTNNDKLRYSMFIQWSDKDQCYLVELPEWGGRVMPTQYVARGDTYEEAAKHGREVLETYIESCEIVPEKAHTADEEKEWEAIVTSPKSQASLDKLKNKPQSFVDKSVEQNQDQEDPEFRKGYEEGLLVAKDIEKTRASKHYQGYKAAIDDARKLRAKAETLGDATEDLCRGSASEESEFDKGYKAYWRSQEQLKEFLVSEYHQGWKAAEQEELEKQ